VPVGTIKKHATGKGNADKAAMVAAMRGLGFGPADDNEVDALVLLAWACAGQPAAIVAGLQDWARAHKQGGNGSNQHAEQTGNVAGLQTVAQRAAESGASERTQRMADKVSTEDPELALKVAHGEVSLPTAASDT
jgi:hypothetical protein